MARPSKSVQVLEREKKSHRTKAEIEQRKKVESALITGKELKERPEVKNSPLAHKEFRRVVPLLRAIEKNDAMYEAIINRYCLLQAECTELAEIKEEFRQSREELKEEYAERKIGEGVDGGLKPSTYYKLLSVMQGNILAIDRQIQAKQKMIFDIEKECAMTISSAMRSVPKTPSKAENPLLEVLRDG